MLYDNINIIFYNRTTTTTLTYTTENTKRIKLKKKKNKTLVLNKITSSATLAFRKQT